MFSPKPASPPSSASSPPPVEVESEVVGVSASSTDPRRRPTNYEVAAHAANVLDAASGVATTVGADGVAEVAREAAGVARAIPVAVEGVKREVEPLAKAGKGLWDVLERRGWVSMRPPRDFTQLQKRGPRKVKEKSK